MSFRVLFFLAVFALLAVAAFANTKVNYEIQMPEVTQAVQKNNIIAAMAANANLQSAVMT